MKKHILLLIGLIVVLCVPAYAGMSNSITVNDAYAKVTQRFRGDDAGPTVILVEDMHSSYQAQHSTIGILTDLVVQTGTESVYVEGSDETYRLDQLRSFPFIKEKRSVMLEEMQKGTFTGYEAAQVLSPHQFSLVGIEESQLFWEAHREFVFIGSRHQSVYKEIGVLKNALASVTKKLFNERLQKFDVAARAYEENRAPLRSFIPTLYDALDSLEIDYTQFLTLLQLRNALVAGNQVHFPSLDAEIEDLTQELMELFGQEATYFKRYKAGDISQQHMVMYLYSQAVKRGVSLEDYMNIPKAVQFWRAESGIDAEKRDEEIRQANDAIRMKLAATTPERDLIQIAVVLRKVERLLLFETTREEAEAFITDPDQCDIVTVIARVTELAPQAVHYKVFMIPSLLQHAQTFYQKVLAREVVMLDRLLSLLTERTADSGIVVIGKEHVSGIEDLLQERKISYVTVRPNGRLESKDVRFMDRMLGYKGSIQWPAGMRPASLYNASLSLLNKELFDEQLNNTYDAMEVSLIMDEKKRVLKPDEVRAKLERYSAESDLGAVDEFALLKESLVHLSAYVKSGQMLKDRAGVEATVLQGLVAQSRTPMIGLDLKTLALQLTFEKKMTAFMAALNTKTDRDFAATINEHLFRADFNFVSNKPQNCVLLLHEGITDTEEETIHAFAQSIGVPVVSCADVTAPDTEKVYLYVGVEPTEEENRLLEGFSVTARVYLGTRADRRARYISYFDVLFLALCTTAQTPIEDVASPEQYFKQL